MNQCRRERRTPEEERIVNTCWPVLALLAAIAAQSIADPIPPTRAVDPATPRLTLVPGDCILDARSELRGKGESDVFLRALVVANRGSETLAVTRVSFDLQCGGRSIRQAVYGPAALAERAASFRKVLPRLAGDAGRLVFGPDTALAGIPCAESTVLAPGEQLGLLREHLSARTAMLPDRLVATVWYAAGDSESSVAAAVPVRRHQSATTYRFPVTGTWVAFGTHDDVYQHRLFAMEEFGFDLAALGPGGEAFSGDGSRNEDYPMYGRDVLAVADGEVTSALDGLPENAPGASPDPTGLDSLITKVGFAAAVAGNHVIIAHPGGEYSFYAHLMSGSVTVKPGWKVKRGERIGRLGNSGNSTGPHLHFQLMDGPTLFSRGLPCRFGNVLDPYPDGDSMALPVRNAALFIAK
jgi:hypothetical protein